MGEEGVLASKNLAQSLFVDILISKIYFLALYSLTSKVSLFTNILILKFVFLVLYLMNKVVVTLRTRARPLHGSIRTEVASRAS